MEPNERLEPPPPPPVAVCPRAEELLPLLPIATLLGEAPPAPTVIVYVVLGVKVEVPVR
jgi:hypothetical protein